MKWFLKNNVETFILVARDNKLENMKWLLKKNFPKIKKF